MGAGGYTQQMTELEHLRAGVQERNMHAIGSLGFACFPFLAIRLMHTKRETRGSGDGRDKRSSRKGGDLGGIFDNDPPFLPAREQPSDLPVRMWQI
jgi:hypothetical protein